MPDVEPPPVTAGGPRIVASVGVSRRSSRSAQQRRANVMAIVLGLTIAIVAALPHDR